MKRIILAYSMLGLSLLVAYAGQAQINYIETVHAPLGMFSTDNLNPTSIGALGIGMNTVSGSVSNARNGHRTTDVYTFEILEGTQLESFLVSDFSSGSSVAFAGLHTGTSYPHNAAGLDAINNTFSGYQAIGGSTFNGLIDEGTFFGTVFLTKPVTTWVTCRWRWAVLGLWLPCKQEATPSMCKKRQPQQPITNSLSTSAPPWYLNLRRWPCCWFQARCSACIAHDINRSIDCSPPTHIRCDD